MKRILLLLVISLMFWHIRLSLAAEQNPDPAQTVASQSSHEAMACTAFSPYVDNLTPKYGAQPSKALIENLLDNLISQTPFRCIMTYGVMNGLEQIFPAAEARQLQVISIIWLDDDPEMNSRSIEAGIGVAKAYPKTIVRLSCGSEVRTRHGKAFDGEILRCMDALRQAGVTQPITTIDTWWEWCDRELACRQNLFSGKVDWIGANIFPWWENKYSGLHACTTAEQAADFHIARLTDLHAAYPGKEVIVTEFGWPNGPENGTEINVHTRQHCGIANLANQTQVVNSTLKKLAEKQWSGVVFEAYSENWKPGNEGQFGSYWGVCQGKPPYSCNPAISGK